ncbi:hypothetical protein [Pontimicrobium sp. MEBiC06410]
MDKKYLNGILIIFLIVIWGSVVYKYFVKESIVLQENTINISNSTIDYAIAKDTFTLKLTSRDPFKASKRRIVKNNKQTSTYTIAVNKNKSAKKLIWPNIEYYGFVKSTQNETKMVLVKINGKLYRKREKETIDDGLKIIKAQSNSIVIAFNKENKTIMRKH